MNHTNGAIAEQSKQRLMKALLSVMEQYAYSEITVTQIAQEARLSRKTFYRLFPHKDALLSFMFEQLFQQCFAQIKARRIRHYWDMVQLYFDFWESRKELLTLLGKHELLPRLFDASYQHAAEVFEWIRSKTAVDSFALPLPYLLAYSVGGMHSMLLKWVERGMDVPSAELVAVLQSGFASSDL